MDSFIKDKSYKIKSNNKFSIIPDNVNFKVDIVEIKSGYNGKSCASHVVCDLCKKIEIKRG